MSLHGEKISKVTSFLAERTGTRARTHTCTYAYGLSELPDRYKHALSANKITFLKFTSIEFILKIHFLEIITPLVFLLIIKYNVVIQWIFSCSFVVSIKKSRTHN